MVALSAQAQFKFGLKAGLNLVKPELNTDAFKTANSAGFFIGPMAEVTIPILGFGVDGALLFSQRGVKINDYTDKEHGLEIPIHMKYTFGLGSILGVYVAAGPNFFFNFAKDTKLADQFNLTQRDAQVGLNLGAGVKLLKHLQVGLNYTIPLGNSSELTILNGTQQLLFSKNKMWQLSAAYLF